MDRLNERAIELVKGFRGCSEVDQKQLLMDSIVDCMTELALEPVWRECCRRVGLLGFERKTRRCVYPNGRTIPILAWRVEGEPENATHKALEEEAKRLYSRKVFKMGIDHERG